MEAFQSSGAAPGEAQGPGRRCFALRELGTVPGTQHDW